MGEPSTLARMAERQIEPRAAIAGERTYRQQTPAQRRAERRSRLIDAAVEAFGTRGYAGTSIDELCGAAAISTRNFYEEFSTREALLLALHDQVNDAAFEAVVMALTHLDPADAEARAVAGIGAYFDVMTTDPRWARIAVIETVGVSPAAEQHRRGSQDRFAGLLRDEFCRLADLGVAPRRDYSLSAMAAVGAVTELVSAWSARTHEACRREDVTAEAVRFILAAIGHTPEDA
jgi:AcrR family transcriptional regulator